MSSLPQYRLPDVVAQWPWPRKLNQHYQQAKAESNRWLHDFEALDAKAQNVFDICDGPLLCSLGFPSLDKDRLRVACDLMVVLLLLDEYTDNTDGDEARTCADMVTNVFENPHVERPQGESIIGEITRQFWLRAMQVASEGAQRRFIRNFTKYIYGVVDEAFDRTRGHIRSTADYITLRKLTLGGQPTFLCIELGLEIPDEVYEHHALQSLLEMTAEITIITNDLYSYNKEQAAGHGGHNILTAYMNEKGVDLDGALDWLAKYNDEVQSKFQEQRGMLPSWNPDVDRVVNEFVERLGDWVRGQDCWSFESRRYFGTKGREVKEHRMVTLLPRVTQPGVLVTAYDGSMVQPSALKH